MNFYRMLRSSRLEPTLVITLAVCATYAIALKNGFIAITDDEINLRERSWLSIWRDPYEGMYIPITYSFWKITKAIFPCEGWVYHTISILIHIVNANLVYEIARKLKVKYAMFAALIWALHPWQAEVVAWATCQRDLLGAMFGLCAFIFPGSFVWFLLAVWSKNSMLVLALPLIVTVSGRWHKVAILAVAVAGLSYLVGLQPSPQISYNPFAQVGYYFVHTLLPQPMIDHGVKVSLWYALAVPSVLGLCILSRYLWISAFFLFPVLLPISFFNWSFAADRYMYLPLIGVAFALCELGACLNARGIRLAVGIVLVLALSAFTFSHVIKFKSVFTVYEHSYDEGHPVSACVLGQYFERAGLPGSARSMYWDCAEWYGEVGFDAAYAKAKLDSL